MNTKSQKHNFWEKEGVGWQTFLTVLFTFILDSRNSKQFHQKKYELIQTYKHNDKVFIWPAVNLSLYIDVATQKPIRINCKPFVLVLHQNFTQWGEIILQIHATTITSICRPQKTSWHFSLSHTLSPSSLPSDVPYKQHKLQKTHHPPSNLLSKM